MRLLCLNSSLMTGERANEIIFTNFMSDCIKVTRICMNKDIRFNVTNKLFVT